jgi:hypothetical protein
MCIRIFIYTRGGAKFISQSMRSLYRVDECRDAEMNTARGPFNYNGKRPFWAAITAAAGRGVVKIYISLRDQRQITCRVHSFMSVAYMYLHKRILSRVQACAVKRFRDRCPMKRKRYESPTRTIITKSHFRSDEFLKRYKSKDLYIDLSRAMYTYMCVCVYTLHTAINSFVRK